jgi:O-antigen/teichoic acid export membrane protein
MSAEDEAELEVVESLGASKGRAVDVSTLARRSSLNLIGAALFGLFSFASLVIVARGFGPERSGTFLEAVAFFTIATSLVVFGFDESLVRAVSRHLASGEVRALRHTLLVALIPLLAFAGLMAVVVWASAPQVARFLQGESSDGGLARYLRIFALALPFTAMYYAVLAATRGFGTMVPTLAIERIGRTCAQTLGAGLVVAIGGSVDALTLTWVLPFVVGTFLAAWQLRGLIRREEARSSRQTAPPPISTAAREFWTFSSLRGIASILNTTFLWLDTLLVGALVSASAAAIYTTSSRMVRLGSLVLLAMIQAVGPQISELLSRHQRSRAEHVYRISTWWLMAITWPLYITMAIFAPLLLRVFGSDFATGAAVVATMSAAMLLSTGVGPVDMVLLMGGKSGWNLINTVVSLATNVVLNLILVPQLGIEGAAIAWAVSVALNNLLPYAEVRALLRISPFAMPGLVPALGALISFGVVGCLARLALGPTIAGLVLSLGVGTCLYVVLLHRFGSSLEFGSLTSSFRVRSGKDDRARARPTE